MTPIKNIIFDWSGTLVDDLPAVLHATNHVFERVGLEPFTMDRFRSEFALPFDGFYRRYLPSVPLPQLEIWFHEEFSKKQDSVAELPYARDFLECCRARGIRMFLLSTLQQRHFGPQTARNGFDQFLERSYLGIADKRHKIHEVLSENGLDARATLFVGDMEHDMDAARHGGVHCCAVLTGYTRVEQLRRSSPDAIVENLGELLACLERNNWHWVPQKT